MLSDRIASDTYAAFVRDVEPNLSRALIAGFGSDIGREAAADALVYGWQHWDRVQAMENPAGYLFRAGQNFARKMTRTSRQTARHGAVVYEEPWAEPGLDAAWSSLSERQRVVAGLVHGFGWSHQEVADLLEVSRASVQTHERRALSKLRTQLGVGE